MSKEKGREGERESSAHFGLRGEPNTGLELITLRSYPELKRVGSLTDHTTRTPLVLNKNGEL